MPIISWARVSFNAAIALFLSLSLSFFLKVYLSQLTLFKIPPFILFSPRA
jgi:hypothetical protein